MERRLNGKVETYITDLKDSIKQRATELDITDNEKVIQLLQYLYDYARLSFDKEDFQKRKRVKNFVPMFDRCCAKRAMGEQCTRRKKTGVDYCGTHAKGAPHGIIDTQTDVAKVSTQKIELWAQDIQGIVYYIDKFNNVYDTADIVKNQPNPKTIAKYVKDGENYSIPEFNI